MNIALLNAPPNSGKTMIANILKEQYGFVWESFKGSLTALTTAHYGVSSLWWDQGYVQAHKNVPEFVLDDLSRRQALIHVSEDLIKPQYGKTFFGQLLYWRLQRLPKDANVVIDDCGFPDEVIPAIFDLGRVSVFKILRSGCTFDGDSRNWLSSLDLPQAHFYHILNNGSIAQAAWSLVNVLRA